MPADDDADLPAVFQLAGAARLAAADRAQVAPHEIGRDPHRRVVFRQHGGGDPIARQVEIGGMDVAGGEQGNGEGKAGSAKGHGAYRISCGTLIYYAAALHNRRAHRSSW
ncbi:hypothetical protein GCM10007387_17390 [Pseudoduganella albidiflava]|uniref:Uncharacterized protein n=1 Tax=Pseudoduganella albidiflava TaxID=321983 RepID=A0AA87XUX4_9BURK|nr:hypothetical protein GCM10007387_17390 [Pseudoduganella albidiflava]